jgi:hypothetical protein
MVRLWLAAAATGAVLIFLCGVSRAAGDTNFAILTADATAAIAAERSTPEGVAIIAEANHFLGLKPKAKPVVHVEGTMGTADFEVAKDWPRMLALALAYRMTGDRRYLAVLDPALNAWLDVFGLALAPVVESEACLVYPVPPAPHCVNPIDDAELTSLILAHDLARHDLSAATSGKMARFMRNLAQSYLRDIALRNASTNPSVRANAAQNWQSHRVKLATLGAFFVGDAKLEAAAHEAFMTQIDRNMNYQLWGVCANGNKCLTTIDDGSVYDFAIRDALHYAVYDLDPLLDAALAAHAHGEDWYHYVSPHQTSLARAMAWLLPYAAGEKTHEEFVHSTIGFDRQRGDKGWKGYSGLWDRSTAETLFRKGLRLDPSLAKPAIEALTKAPYAADLYDPARSVSDPLVGFLYR